MSSKHSPYEEKIKSKNHDKSIRRGKSPSTHRKRSSSNLSPRVKERDKKRNKPSRRRSRSRSRSRSRKRDQIKIEEKNSNTT